MIYSFILKFLNLPYNHYFNKLFIYWNRFVFKINNVDFGVNMKIYNRFYLRKHPNSTIKIGDNFKFTSGNAINPLCRNLVGCIFLSDTKSQLIIGNNVGISSACIWVKNKITIGNRVLIGGDSIIMDTDAHNLDYKIRSLRLENFNSEVVIKSANELNIELDLLKSSTIDSISANSIPITIEDDVLIGTRCIILKGVTIGARSIIGSGSIVTKSIPADCIAAGNPAKIIKYINQ